MLVLVPSQRTLLPEHLVALVASEQALFLDQLERNGSVLLPGELVLRRRKNYLVYSIAIPLRVGRAKA